MYQALNTIATHTPNPYFASVCYAVADQVTCGVPLASALAKYPHVFNAVNSASSGYRARIGQFACQFLEILMHYLESVLSFRKKLRAAFLLPMITFIFFLLIIGIILMVIVPQFICIVATCINRYLLQHKCS